MLTGTLRWPCSLPSYLGTSMGAPMTTLRLAGYGTSPQGRKTPVPQKMGVVKPAEGAPGRQMLVHVGRAGTRGPGPWLLLANAPAICGGSMQRLQRV